MSDEHELGWTAVCACANEAEVEVVLSYLAGNEIDAISSSSYPYTVFPVNVAGEGDHIIYVRDEDAEAATAMLKDHPRTIAEDLANDADAPCE